MPRDHVEVGDDRDRRRIAARAEAREGDRSREFAAGDHQVLIPLHVRGQRGQRNKRRPDGGEQAQAIGRVFLRDGNLPDGAVQLACVAEIDGFDRRNRRARNLFAAHIHTQPGLRQDHQLGPRVVAFDVAGGIGFGKAELLRLLERGIKSGAGCLHFREDVVAGAVQDSGDAIEPVAGEPFLNGNDGGNSSGHRSAELQLPPRLPRQAQKFRATIRDQKLVRGHHRFSRAERLAYPFARRLETSNHLHKNIRIGGQHLFDVFRPTNLRRNPVGFFACDVAVVNVREYERTVRILR